MMQDQSAEIEVQSDLGKKILQAISPSLSYKKSFQSNDHQSQYSDEGPDDEFKPVQASNVANSETREAYETMVDSIELRMGSDDERRSSGEEREAVEDFDQEREVPLEEPVQAEIRSSVSDLTTPASKSHDQNDMPPMLQRDPSGEKPEQAVVDIDLSAMNEEMEQDTDNQAREGDEISVMTKSAVEESAIAVEEAEKMAQEMQRQVAESLETFSKASHPSSDDEEDMEQADDTDKKTTEELFLFYSKGRVLDLAYSASDDDDETPQSDKIPTPLQRPRPVFGRRRPSTASWSSMKEITVEVEAEVEVESSTTTPQMKHFKKIIDDLSVPAVFLVVSVSICRNFFHQFSDKAQSNNSAFAWAVLVVIALVAPVCAAEYTLSGGLLDGTVIMEKLAAYPEIKQFLREARRKRLKAGWWYPAEVRTLQKDLETTATMVLKDKTEEDDRSLQSVMTREEQHREKTQLEKGFDSERAEWLTLKEELMAEADSAKNNYAKIQDQLEIEQLKHDQVAAQKEQLENNIEVERAQWKFARISLEDALKAAIDAQEDNDVSTDMFQKIERSRHEERNLWEKERQGLQATIYQAEDDAARIREEHEAKIMQFNEQRAARQAEWENERKNLKEAVTNAINEAKSVKDTLEGQLCKLMDANDAKYEKEIKDMKSTFLLQKQALKNALDESHGDLKIASQCVENLQTVLEEERAEWESERKSFQEQVRSAQTECKETKSKLEESNTKLEESKQKLLEERAIWETAAEDAIATLAETNSTTSTADSMSTPAANVEAETSVHEELEAKDSNKIHSLQESIKQLETIIATQEQIEQRTNEHIEKTSARTDLGAFNKLKPVAYIKVETVNEDSSESSSFIDDETDSVDSNSSSYYSWIQKTLKTHIQEQRQLLQSLLGTHAKWQEDQTTASANKDQDNLEEDRTNKDKDNTEEASTTSQLTDDASWQLVEAPTSNPFLKYTLKWKEAWASMLIYRPQRTSFRALCSGFLVSAGVGAGLLHLRATKQFQR